MAAAADEQAGRLRRALTVSSHEASVRELVDELLDDPEFEVRWHAHPVDEKRRGTKVLTHPEVGDLAIAYEVLDVADDSGQQLVTWLPADDATTARFDDAHRRRHACGSSSAADPSDRLDRDNLRAAEGIEHGAHLVEVTQLHRHEQRADASLRSPTKLR